MKDFDPSLPNLELSQSELESLHQSLSKGLVIWGEITENQGVYPPEGKANAYNFTYSLPKDFVRDVFYPSDDDLIVRNESYISYSAPHRLEDEKNDAVTESIYISLRTKFVGTDIACNQSISLGCVSEQYDGLFETEYVDLETGWVISPDDIPHGLDISNEESRRRLLGDMLTFARPLGLDDAEKLRKIEALITAS
jgi:hypothetical protein